MNQQNEFVGIADQNGWPLLNDGRVQHKELLIPIHTLLRAAGVVFRISDITGGNLVWLEDVSTSECKTCEMSQLQAALRDGTIVRAERDDAVQALLVPVQLRNSDQNLIDSIPAAFRSDEAVAVMLNKMKWVRELERYGVKNFNPSTFLQAAIKDIEHKLGISCPYKQDALYLAFRTLRKNDNDPRCLMPKFHLRGGPGGRRVDPCVDKMIEFALNGAARPASGMLRPVKVHRDVVEMVRRHNASAVEKVLAPSLPTVTRRFNERFSPYAVCVRNSGKKRADKLFRETGVRVRVDHALDVVHYDDTDTAIFLTDGRTGLPWGRSWLTVGIDEKTQAVHGLAMSERPRSSESAIEAVINGIYPKDHTGPEFALCRGKWEWYGQPGIVNLDNASYNATLRTQASILEFDAEVAFARPHRPTDKTDIEHFNHRLKAGFIQDLPGWVGPKEDRDLLDVGLGSAVMTIEVFRRCLFPWIVDEYSNTPTGKLGLTPREAWTIEFKDVPPLLPRRHPPQELMGTISQELTMRDSGGLLRMGLRYQSDELATLRKRLGAAAKVMIRYSPHSLRYLYVLDPFSKIYYKVPCIDDPRYVEGLTNFQQHLILKKARIMKKRSPGLSELYDARQMLIRDTDDLMKSKKLRQRKQGFIIQGSGITELHGMKPIATDVANAMKFEREIMVSSVESMVMDIEEEEFAFDVEMTLE